MINNWMAGTIWAKEHETTPKWAPRFQPITSAGIQPSASAEAVVATARWVDSDGNRNVQFTNGNTRNFSLLLIWFQTTRLQVAERRKIQTP